MRGDARLRRLETLEYEQWLRDEAERTGISFAEAEARMRIWYDVFARRGLREGDEAEWDELVAPLIEFAELIGEPDPALFASETMERWAREQGLVASSPPLPAEVAIGGS